jgi:DNA repair exonuclease SbcCD nuclease subunit
MKPFSFVHVADVHLGYAQYNLEARREDFNATFQEVVDKTIELKPDFMLIAGDLFQHARPSNSTLENAITSFRKLRDAGIPVLTVDGGHDSAPNMITGTILNPNFSQTTSTITLAVTFTFQTQDHSRRDFSRIVDALKP